jgi:acyl-CoA thioester hydrolase
MKTYSEVFDVVPSDLDDLNHVNNIRYVEWIQDISKKHWTHVTDEIIQKSLIWVVRNHNITYHKSALLGDTILINTYIESNQGPISTRVVEIKKQKNGRATGESGYGMVPVGCQNLSAQTGAGGNTSLFIP